MRSARPGAVGVQRIDEVHHRIPTGRSIESLLDHRERSTATRPELGDELADQVFMLSSAWSSWLSIGTTGHSAG